LRHSVVTISELQEAFSNTCFRIIEYLARIHQNNLINPSKCSGIRWLHFEVISAIEV